MRHLLILECSKNVADAVRTVVDTSPSSGVADHALANLRPNELEMLQRGSVVLVVVTNHSGRRERIDDISRVVSEAANRGAVVHLVSNDTTVNNNPPLAALAMTHSNFKFLRFVAGQSLEDVLRLFVPEALLSRANVWAETSSLERVLSIQCVCVDRVGLAVQLSRVLAEEEFNIEHLSLAAHGVTARIDLVARVPKNKISRGESADALVERVRDSAYAVLAPLIDSERVWDERVDDKHNSRRSERGRATPLYWTWRRVPSKHGVLAVLVPPLTEFGLSVTRIKVDTEMHPFRVAEQDIVIEGELSAGREVFNGRARKDEAVDKDGPLIAELERRFARPTSFGRRRRHRGHDGRRRSERDRS